MTSPTASVIVAVLDEAENIDHVIETALASPNVVDVVVADGGSTDGTVSRVMAHASKDPRVHLIQNPQRGQSAGLNLAAGLAEGTMLIRLDGHTTYDDDYVERSIAQWQPDLAIGGPMRGIGSGPWSTAVANAMGDPLAIGPARFRHATAPEDVDTVYLGAFARSRYIAIGGYRTFPSGTVEDADFYARWRAAGGIVRVDPSLRSWYHPRETWRAMWRQYLRYGRGKAELVWVNGRLPSWRPLAPAVLVAALTVSGVVAIIGPPLPLAIVAGSWAVAVLAVALRAPSRRLRTAAAVATMHLAYGTGLWAGLLSGRPHVVTIGMEAATDEDLSRPGSTDPKREVGPSEPS